MLVFLTNKKVSTDSEGYAEISREYGAEVPFLRTMECSCDTASSWDVVKEVLSNYKERGRTFDAVYHFLMRSFIINLVCQK